MTETPLVGPLPQIGYGTWRQNGDAARQCVLWALEAGYRHIDTAVGYGNEAEVGAALAESRLARQEVFVTTKIPPDHPVEKVWRDLPVPVSVSVPVAETRNEEQRTKIPAHPTCTCWGRVGAFGSTFFDFRSGPSAAETAALQRRTGCGWGIRHPASGIWHPCGRVGGSIFVLRSAVRPGSIENSGFS